MTTLVGCPPRFQHVPLFHSSAGRDAVDLAEFAGLTLDPWQCDVLEGALGTTAAGRWAAMEVAVIVPRQNGKGGILEARQLFGLYLNPRDELQTHTAHRFDTCLDHFRRVRGLIEGNDELLAKVKRNGIKDSNGKESIELVDGHRLLFKARSKGSGRGFSGDVVYLDEAFYLQGLGDMIPSLSARGDPQVWYSSSAPLPRTESDILRSIIRRGRALCA
jgi:phage terminase large subunit-like protein